MDTPLNQHREIPRISIEKVRAVKSHYIEILSGREDSRDRSGCPSFDQERFQAKLPLGVEP
jgi:hypothetical protein